MATASNYYDILGVSPAADSAAINVAYKKLMKKYHPDLATPENRKSSEERCKTINEARDVLLDPSRRREYDLSRQPRPPRSPVRYPGGESYRTVRVSSNMDGFPMDGFFEDILRNFFGGDLGGGADVFQPHREPPRRPRTPTGDVYEIRIPLYAASGGVEFLNSLFAYYALSLLDYEVREGTKYVTFFCYLRGTEKNLKDFRETLKKRNIKVVKKKL
jgi:DnaJ-class molecular chaperone